MMRYVIRTFRLVRGFQSLHVSAWIVPEIKPKSFSSIFLFLPTDSQSSNHSMQHRVCRPVVTNRNKMPSLSMCLRKADYRALKT